MRMLYTVCRGYSRFNYSSSYCWYWQPCSLFCVWNCAVSLVDTCKCFHLLLCCTGSVKVSSLPPGTFRLWRFTVPHMGSAYGVTQKGRERECVKSLFWAHYYSIMLSKAQIGPIVLGDSLSARTNYFSILLDNCLWRSMVRIEFCLMRCTMIHIIYTYITFELISSIPKSKQHNKNFSLYLNLIQYTVGSYCYIVYTY